MEELFLMEKSSFANNKIVLGIQKDAVRMEESDGGNVLAFINAGRIYSYNADENKFAQLFAFADADNFDARTYYDCSDVKILDVEENGNVSFMVYGYMNRGTHEGEVGIAVYLPVRILSIFSLLRRSRLSFGFLTHLRHTSSINLKRISARAAILS